MAELNPFNDVPTIQEPNSIQEIGGQSVLSAVGGLNIGAGGQSISADPYSGFWVGAKTFADAPFSVDLNGNIHAATLDLSLYLSKAGTGQAITGDMNLGGRVVIDGANVRIVMNDGVSNILLLGKY